MPRREPPPRTLDDRVAAEFEHDFRQVEDRLVAEAGPPPDARRLSEREEDELWTLRDPSIDHDALASRLMTEGLPQEEAEALAVVKEWPNWLPLFMKPTKDAEEANRRAEMAEFPHRWALFADMDTHQDMVEKAERIAARVGWPSLVASEDAPPMPAPEPAMPMPEQPPMMAQPAPPATNGAAY